MINTWIGKNTQNMSLGVSRALRFLKHVNSIIPKNSLVNLCKAIVQPHFGYCCSVSGFCSSAEKDHLQKVENRAARIITRSSFTSPTLPLIKSLGCQTTEELISSETKIMVSKSLNVLTPQYVTALFSRNSQGYFDTCEKREGRLTTYSQNIYTITYRPVQ